MTYPAFLSDDNVLAESIRHTFGLGSSAFPLRRIGTGFKSIVLGSPTGLVFRVALNKKAQTGHKRECYVLPRLKSLLPVEVPEVLGYCEESDDFPFGAMMQKKIEGPALGSVLKRSPRVKPIASLMGELVLAIQTIRQDELPELLSSSAPQPEETWSYAHSYLKANLTPRELHRAEEWWEQYCEDWEQGCPVQRFSHGDLWHEHVLFQATDEPRIAGVLDWEFAGFGDPIMSLLRKVLCLHDEG